VGDWTKTDYLAEMGISDHVKDQYVLFTLNGQFFGVPILVVREIIEPPVIQKMPNSVKDFLGLINLRGQIVGVFDLGSWLGLNCEWSDINRLLIFDVEEGLMGALVERVDSVVNISDKNIERDVAIDSRVPPDFLLGVAKYRGHLVTLVNLQEILASQEIVTVASSKLG